MLRLRLDAFFGHQKQNSLTFCFDRWIQFSPLFKLSNILISCVCVYFRRCQDIEKKDEEKKKLLKKIFSAIFRNNNLTQDNFQLKEL